MKKSHRPNGRRSFSVCSHFIPNSILCQQEVFFIKEKSLTTKQFLQKADDLTKRDIKFAYVNIKLHRLGNSIWNYEKIKTKYPDIEFAVALEDDLDEIDVS